MEPEAAACIVTQCTIYPIHSYGGRPAESASSCTGIAARRCGQKQSPRPTTHPVARLNTERHKLKNQSKQLMSSASQKKGQSMNCYPPAHKSIALPSEASWQPRVCVARGAAKIKTQPELQLRTTRAPPREVLIHVSLGYCSSSQTCNGTKTMCERLETRHGRVIVIRLIDDLTCPWTPRRIGPGSSLFHTGIPSLHPPPSLPHTSFLVAGQPHNNRPRQVSTNSPKRPQGQTERLTVANGTLT